MSHPAGPRPPRPLFDPNTQSPPRDAVELYLELPATISIMYFLGVAHGYPYLPGIAAARKAGQAAVLRLLCGNVTMRVGQHYQLKSGGTSGLFSPGQLEVTVVEHVEPVGNDFSPWLHEHFYIGATGIADHDGGRWPVAWEDVRAVAGGCCAVYDHALETAVYDDPGWVFQNEVLDNDDGTWVQREIAGVHPELLEKLPRPICPTTNPRQRWDLRERAGYTRDGLRSAGASDLQYRAERAAQRRAQA